jgi:P27 family predicted phage terminase small subunit
MAGRRPKPTALKLVAGNPGKRAINKNEPKPKSDAPECPPQLNEVEREAWVYLVSELGAMGILASSDRAEMSSYCCAWSQWVEAQHELTRAGKVLLVRKKPQRNPWLGIRNEAQRDLCRYGGNLGLNPSQRSRIKTNNGKEKDSDEKRFFG